MRQFSSAVESLLVLDKQFDPKRPVEIDPEFRGALITKEGKLYDDEEYDETYKKKLRLREVYQIQKYIQ